MPELPPQIRSLEVVGRKLQTHCSKMSNQVGRTEALGASDAVEVAQSTVTIQQPVSGLGVRINGINFWPHNPEFSPTIDRTFASQPFQRHLRPIIRIENIGSQELSLQWKKVNFFSNNNTLMEADPDDFVFDVDPFVLLPGEFRDVTVLYQPRCVAIVKQRWLLLTCPRIFFCRPSGFTLNLNGRCTPPKNTWTASKWRSFRCCRMRRRFLCNSRQCPSVHMNGSWRSGRFLTGGTEASSA